MVKETYSGATMRCERKGLVITASSVLDCTGQQKNKVHYFIFVLVQHAVILSLHIQKQMSCGGIKFSSVAEYIVAFDINLVL